MKISEQEILDLEKQVFTWLEDWDLKAINSFIKEYDPENTRGLMSLFNVSVFDNKLMFISTYYQVNFITETQFKNKAGKIIFYDPHQPQEYFIRDKQKGKYIPLMLHKTIHALSILDSLKSELKSKLNIH